MKPFITALLSEFLGTFFFIFGGCGAIMISALYPGAVPSMLVPIAFGLSISVMVFVFAASSGAHFNPSVTLGLALAKRFSWAKVLPYIIVQCAGGIVAILLLTTILPATSTLGVTAPTVSAWQAVIWEAVLTGLLVFAVLSLVTSEAKPIAGSLIVGFAITTIVILGGATSGGSANLARSLGPALISGNFTHFWIYIVGPFAGAILASLVYQVSKFSAR